MLNTIKTKIKFDINHIEQAPSNHKSVEIKQYLKQLVDLYNLNTLTEIQLGYYIASLVQFEKDIPYSPLFSEILKTAIVADLPDSQIKKIGYARSELTEKLLNNIRKYLK